MIKQETCKEIWECYHEIEAGEKLLQELEELEQENKHLQWQERIDKKYAKLVYLEMKIPMKETGSYSVKKVSPALGKSVLRSHIALQQARLKELNEIAIYETHEDN